MARARGLDHAPRLRIFDPGGRVVTAGRIAVADGTVAIGDTPDGEDGSYVPEARVPRPEWRPADAATLAALAAPDGPCDWSQTIGLARIDDALLAQVQAALLDGGGDAAAIKRRAREPAVQEVVQRMEEDLTARYATRRERFRSLGVHAQPAAGPTQTIEGPRQAKLGLHVDSWDRMPLGRRPIARNRLAVNLGRQPRHLLFVDLPIAAIAQVLAEAERASLPLWKRWRDRRPSPAGMPVPAMPRAFLALCPDYPVIRMTLAPGEGYIAPTENMIHDGCCAADGAMDVHLTLLGDFAAVP